MTTSTIDLNKPIETQDGRAVRIISTDGVEPYVLVGYIDQNDQPCTWKADGSYAATSSYHGLDLRNVTPTPIISYVNIYKEGFSHYSSRSEADRHAADSRLGRQRVELIPGTWDD